VPLDATLGFDAPTGRPVNVVSHFPDQTRLLRPDGAGFKLGDTLSVWMRPFEVLMLEVTPSSSGIAGLPVREVTYEDALELGTKLALKPDSLEPHLDVNFADAARFQQMQMTKKTYAFDAELPVFDDEKSPVLAVTVQLRQGEKEWRYKPVVCEIVQAVAHIGDQDVQFVPVPDGRQFGNTQSFGSSWVTYKTRLGRQWSGKNLKLAVHAYLPAGVEARVEAFVVKRWWNENTRPIADGYYNDAPS
jgi:hypothetical protein